MKPSSLKGVSKVATSASRLPSHDEIAQRASALWQERGCPEGRDEEFWLEAERELRHGSAMIEDDFPSPGVYERMEQLDDLYPDQFGPEGTSL